MTTEERARLRALCEAATPGPWRYDPAWGGGGILDGDGGAVADDVWTANGPIIAEARTAIPALLDALDAAEAGAAALRVVIESALGGIHDRGTPCPCCEMVDRGTDHKDHGDDCPLVGALERR